MTASERKPSFTDPLSRGSEWRRWDLHVHSPLSALNNQFPHLSNGEPDWERYLQGLERLSDVAVVGITDYFSIEGYRKVREFRGKGRLQNISLVLPNIELRLSTFVGGSKGDRRINYHVIFSEDISEDDIENHFLRQLAFTYESAPDDANTSWLLNRVNLEALGARLRREHPDFQGSDYQVGCKNATVDPDSIKQLLWNKASLFRGRYLLIVENTSSMDWDSQDHLTRKVLLQGAHMICTAPDFLDTELSLFMQQLLAQGAAAEPAAA